MAYKKKKTVHLKFSTLNLQNYLEPPNAYYDFEQIYSSLQWNKKQAWIKSYLEKSSPDVIGFQEVFSVNALKQLTESSGFLYFGVIDSPTVEGDFIFSDPVVAIASKYPIKDVSAVEYDKQTIEQLGLLDSMSFVKRILRATIVLPHIGLTDFYVVHFKSQRALIHAEHDSSLTHEQNFCEFFKAEIAGGWASSIVRGSEAVLLQQEIISKRMSSNNPIVLMGDFNDSIENNTLKYLLQRNLFDNTFKHDERLIEKYALKDSWDIYSKRFSTSQDSENTLCINRESTHYFGGKGSVLDYILLSQEFDATSDLFIYEVIEHVTLNEHIVNPVFDVDGCSTDHAVVEVVLKLRS